MPVRPGRNNVPCWIPAKVCNVRHVFFTLILFVCRKDYHTPRKISRNVRASRKFLWVNMRCIYGVNEIRAGAALSWFAASWRSIGHANMEQRGCFSSDSTGMQSTLSPLEICHVECWRIDNNSVAIQIEIYVLMHFIRKWPGDCNRFLYIFAQLSCHVQTSVAATFVLT